MKIAMLAPYARLGGTERQIALLAAQLVRGGHTVYLLSPEGPMAEAYRATGACIREVPLLQRQPLAGWLATVRVLRTLDVEVIHAHAGLELVLAACVARPRTPRVFTNHGYTVSFDYWKDALLLPALATHTVSVSRSEAERLVRYGARADGLTVIHNGIVPLQPNAAARERLRHEWAIPAGHMLVGVVGRLEPQKGHMVLLDALLRLRDLPLYAVLIGTGSLLATLRRRAQELGIGDRLCFAGPYQPVEEALSALDVFAFPSLWEPFGLAALEAMSCGLPLVASRVGGLPEFIEHKYSGLLVPPGDAKALAAALRQLYEDEPLRQRLAEGARHAADGFRAARMAQQYEQLYQAAVDLSRRTWRERLRQHSG